MTPIGRIKRRLAVLTSTAAANDYLAAIGRYGAQARKVSAAADSVMRAMNAVMLAVGLEESGAAPGLDLDAIFAQEIAHAALAAGRGLKDFEQLSDPEDIFFGARRREAAAEAKAALGRTIGAAADLLLACGQPPAGDIEGWTARYVEHSRRLLDARTAALQATLAGVRRGHPGVHFMQCLVSHSVMDRLAFDLFLLDRIPAPSEPDEIRARFEKEAGLALAAAEHGAAAVQRHRRKLARAVRPRSIKPIRVLDELERSFDVERRIVPVYTAVVRPDATPQAVAEGLLMLQPLLEERTRLIDERHRILAS